MGILRHRRFRRQADQGNDEPEDDYEDEGEGEGEDDEYDDSSVTLNPVLPTTTTESQVDKFKAIGKDVVEKVPSKSNSFIHIFRHYLTFIKLSKKRKKLDLIMLI